MVVIHGPSVESQSMWRVVQSIRSPDGIVAAVMETRPR